MRSRLRGVFPRLGARALALGALPALLSLGVALALVRSAEAGEVPPMPSEVEPTRGARDVVELAGSGSNVPIVRAAVARFGPDALRVHPSIGSGGGLRALRDGVIDAALVSRPLRARERAGLTRHCFARVPVVFAAHPRVRQPQLSRAQILAAYRGERAAWPSDEPLFVFQREPGDSSHATVRAGWPEFASVDQESWERRLFVVPTTDQAMVRALMDTEGSLGLVDLGLLRLERSHLQPLTFDGVVPSAESVASRDYTFSKELAIVTRDDVPLRPALAEFLEFLASAAARDLLRSWDYEPLAGCHE